MYLLHLILTCLLVAVKHTGAFVLPGAQTVNSNLRRSYNYNGDDAGPAAAHQHLYCRDLGVNMKMTPSENVQDEEQSNRRGFLLGTPLAFLSTLIVLPGLSSVRAVQDKTIVVTGANSGIGFEACKRLAQGGATLVLACRTLDKAQDTVNRIRAANVSNGVLIPAACDLASLKSIEAFAQNLAVPTIDTLCLNAGISRNVDATDCARTRDGFELTVGTNHFGHFYLHHLLRPKLSRTAQIVVTASGVHDPESPGGKQGVPAALGDMQGLILQGRDCEMVDGSPFNADKAYKDSKLCNVLFTRELQRRLDRDQATKGMAVNCFNPGLIVGTGLFRDQNPIFTKLFDVAATNVFKVGESPEWGGAALAFMTTVNTKGLYYNSPPGSSKYGDDAFGKQFAPSPVSKEGQDDAEAQQFWELSSKLLGIPA